YIKTVVRVETISRHFRHAQRWDSPKSCSQRGGVPTPSCDHAVEAAQLRAAHRRLNFGQPPVSSHRLMHPAISGRMLAPIHRVVALAVVLEAPGQFPQTFIIGRDHSAFTRSGYD